MKLSQSASMLFCYFVYYLVFVDIVPTCGYHVSMVGFTFLLEDGDCYKYLYNFKDSKYNNSPPRFFHGIIVNFRPFSASLVFFVGDEDLG